jgi:hypothetical protein
MLHLSHGRGLLPGAAAIADDVPRQTVVMPSGSVER